MNDKKARELRKKAKYKPSDDPIEKRKYRVLVCKKVPKVNGRPLVTTRQNSGHMVVCKDPRFQYRALKKRYKAGML